MNKLFLPMVIVTVMTPGLHAGMSSGNMNNEMRSAGSMALCTAQGHADWAREGRGAHDRDGRGGD